MNIPWLHKKDQTHNIKVGQDVAFIKDGSSLWEPQYGDLGKVIEIDNCMVKVKFQRSFRKLNGDETDEYTCDPTDLTNKVLDRFLAMANARRKIWEGK